MLSRAAVLSAVYTGLSADAPRITGLGSNSFEEAADVLRLTPILRVDFGVSVIGDGCCAAKCEKMLSYIY